VYGILISNIPLCGAKIGGGEELFEGGPYGKILRKKLNIFAMWRS